MFTDSLRSGGKIRGDLELFPRTATEVPLLITGVASQTADLFQIKNSGGTELMSLDADGNLNIAGTMTVVDTEVADDFEVTDALTVGGLTTLNGNTVIGTDHINTLTVNAGSNFIGDVTTRNLRSSATLTASTVNISGVTTFGLNVLIDATNAEAFLVRKDGDGGDVFLVDTTNSDVQTATITPLVTNSSALGTASLMWSDLFLAEGGIINWNNGDVTLEHAANSLTIDGGTTIFESGAVQMGDADSDTSTFTMIKGAQTGDPQVQFALSADANGNFSITADTGDITLVAADDMFFSVDGNIELSLNGTELYPETSNGLSLGTGSKMFSDLFLASGGVINFNNGDATLTHSADLLAFAGAASGYTFDGEVDISGTDTILLDLNPSNTTTQTVIDITPSATIGAAAIWKGIYLNGDALDPSDVGAEIYGLDIDFSTVSITNSPIMHGIRVGTVQAEDAIHITEGQLHMNTALPSTVAQESTSIDVIIDVSSQAASSVHHALDVATAGGTPSGSVVAVGTHVNVKPIVQAIGSFSTPSQTEYAGRKTGGGVTWADGVDANECFIADDDEVLVGATAQFSEIEVIMTTPGTKSVQPTFWYNTAADTWTQFFPADDTDGFQNNGTIRWTLASISASWTNDGDPGAANSSTGYWIKIKRTANPDPGTPTPTTVKTGTATNYSWDESGDLSVGHVSLKNAGALRTGTTASDTLLIQARDTDGSWDTWITLTAGSTSTCALEDGVTATTQSVNDNSTKVATTAYVDASIDTVDTWAEVLANGNTSGGTDVAVSNGDGIVVGHTALIAAADITAETQILGTAAADSSIVCGLWSETDALEPTFRFLKSGHASIGATNKTTVADNEILGSIQWYPADGTDLATLAASFGAEVDDATPAAGDIGIAFVWRGMPGGAGAIADVLRLDAVGNLSPGVTDGGALGTASLMWSDLFVASGSVLNWDNGDVTLTHSAGILTFGGDGTVTIDFASHEMTNVDIDSGTIDGVTTINFAAGAARTFSIATDNTEGDALTVVAGSGGTGAVNGGALNLTGGAAGSDGNRTGGAVYIAGGVDGGTSVGGAVYLRGGAGDTNGTVYIGDSNTAGLTIGVAVALGANDLVLTGAVGRDTDNEINWGTDDSLALVIAGTTHAIVSITDGAGDNDKLVTQGYVDDAVATVDTWAEVLALGNTSGGTDVIVSNGDGIVVGHTALLAAADVTAEVQVLGTAAADTSVVIGLWSETDALEPTMRFLKSGHATIGAANNTTVADNEILGSVQWYAADGTDLATMTASFGVEVDDGSPAAGDIGSAFVWRNLPGGAGAIADTLRLSAAGDLTPGVTDQGGLGTASLMWGDLFLASGAVVNFNNGDVTLTHASDSLSVGGGNFIVQTAYLDVKNSASVSHHLAHNNVSYLGNGAGAIRRVGFAGVTSPTAKIHIGAGEASASGAPLKFTTGVVLTNPEAGTVEFVDDAFYGTITTGPTRKTFAFLESPSFTTPALGTPASGTLTNCDGTAAGLTAGAVSTITGLAPDTATTQATQAAITTCANLVTVGALASGSIASGFGTISTGNSITTTSDISGGGILVTGDTTAGDAAALGYTATEGIIVTGQGSTNDVTIKNDADAQVLAILTGTTTVQLGVDGTASKIQLTEKASIALDPAGGADGDYSGITFTATAGETVAFGDVVYLKAADSEWYLCDADATATAGVVAVAICVSSGTNGNPVTLMSHGIIRADAGFPALTIGAPVYISTTGTTTNTVTVTAPSGEDDVIKIVGHALTADEILFNPSVNWTTAAA